MCENPDILNLHYLKRDSDKTEQYARPPFLQWTAEKQDEVAHLAVARTQNTGNGILGIRQKIKLRDS